MSALDYKESLFLCGYPCAGKTTAGRYLAERYGFYHIEASDFLYTHYYRRIGLDSTVEISEFAECSLSTEPYLVPEGILAHLHDVFGVGIVISGLRSMREIEWLNSRRPQENRHFKVFFVSADKAGRFRRMSNRKCLKGHVSVKQFEESERIQDRLGVVTICQSDGVTKWFNNGTIASFFGHIDDVMKNRNRRPICKNDLWSTKQLQPESSLENAVLGCLFDAGSRNSLDCFFTTIDIVSMLLEREFSSTCKNVLTDDVNEYFESRYRPYFRITRERKSTSKAYRLSGTGYSRVLGLIRREKVSRQIGAS